jgi:hypothetical protein
MPAFRSNAGSANCHFGKTLLWVIAYERRDRMISPAPLRSFFSDRGYGLAIIVLIMLAVSLAQASISASLSYGTLIGILHSLMSPVMTKEVLFRFAVPATEVLRISLTAAAAILFLMRRKLAMFRLVIAANSLFTVGLLAQTSGLIEELFGTGSIDAKELMGNVVLMIISNILIFSLWYWIIDPPGVEQTRHDDKWDFLFPQRGGALPHYHGWEPHYVDYLFLAFMTSFAFSPTDTLPLSSRAKMLMLLQASISVITLVVIASGGINILSGSK